MHLNAELLRSLKKEYGEAFYLLDSAQFRQNFIELKSAFSSIYSNFNIAYSYKTNYTPKLCKIVNELGGYAEVVSEMELELAYRVGVVPQKIIWNGPIKDINKVKSFLLDGGTVNIDSISEAKEIQKFALENSDSMLNVGIRCNFDVDDGVISRFGFDIHGKDFQKVLSLIKDTDNLHLINFHCHFAKRQIEYWPARARGMCQLIKSLDIMPERIDIGGGLFGKMAESLKEQFSFSIPTYAEYAQVAASEFAAAFSDEADSPELLIEPGSALVGDCMKFAGTVKTIKNVRGKYYASVLGSQKNISMTGVNPPIEVVQMVSEAKSYKDVDFVGFTCIEGDCLHKGYSGPLAVGDVVIISNCGSYSLVMKPPFILPNFPVLDISGGSVEVIKRAESFDDIFRTYTM